MPYICTEYATNIQNDTTPLEWEKFECLCPLHYAMPFLEFHPADTQYLHAHNRRVITCNSSLYLFNLGFPGGSVVQNVSANAAVAHSIPAPGTALGEENGNPLQCSCLGNLRDREAWWATVHGVQKSDMTATKYQQHSALSVVRHCSKHHTINSVQYCLE